VRDSQSQFPVISKNCADTRHMSRISLGASRHSVIECRSAAAIFGVSVFNPDAGGGSCTDRIVG
jgi:hypothetical protein